MALPVIPYDPWFDIKINPFDLMKKNEDINPRPEEEIADLLFDATPSSVEPQDESDDIENTKSIHQKMYEIATSKYNPFAVGGSENIHDFDKK